jgi:hypothetical protein
MQMQQSAYEYPQQDTMFHYYPSAGQTGHSPAYTMDMNSPSNSSYVHESNHQSPQNFLQPEMAASVQPDSYPTPSPESIQSAQSVNSPDHWSSTSSPPANSDWSDCMSSPQGLMYHPGGGAPQNKQPEAIYI